MNVPLETSIEIQGRAASVLLRIHPVKALVGKPVTLHKPKPARGVDGEEGVRVHECTNALPDRNRVAYLFNAKCRGRRDFARHMSRAERI